MQVGWEIVVVASIGTVLAMQKFLSPASSFFVDLFGIIDPS